MQNQKTFIITGGNAGIGKATALSLAGKGLHVVIVSRDPEKGKAALNEIAAGSGSSTVELVTGSLDTIESTKALARIIIEKYPGTSVLINNAGIWMREKIINRDGLEYTFMVNHMAPFILSNLLYDTLKRNAPARIVNVNAALYVFGAFDPEKTPYGKDFSRYKTYMNTKFCNALFTRKFAGMIEGSGITINALHPGVIRTGLVKYPGVRGKLWGLLKQSLPLPEKGAIAPVRLAADPELQHTNGRFFMQSKEMGYIRKAKDDKLAERLWELSAELSGIKGA